MVLRDRDANTAWHAEADGTLEERRYYCQNWRADVSAVLTDTGAMVEWIKYSAYGVPFALPAGDTDSDGDFDATDLGNFGGAYDVREDVNLDGTVDTADPNAALAIHNGYMTSTGRGHLSSPVQGNRKGYAGYEYDPTFNGAGRHLYHVRNRVYDADVGRWTRRDPLGYVDGMSLYGYVQGMAIIAADPFGLQGGIGSQTFCGASGCSAVQVQPADPLAPTPCKLYCDYACEPLKNPEVDPEQKLWGQCWVHCHHACQEKKKNETYDNCEKYCKTVTPPGRLYDACLRACRLPLTPPYIVPVKYHPPMPVYPMYPLVTPHEHCMLVCDVDKQRRDLDCKSLPAKNQWDCQINSHNQWISCVNGCHEKWLPPDERPKPKPRRPLGPTRITSINESLCAGF